MTKVNLFDLGVCIEQFSTHTLSYCQFVFIHTVPHTNISYRSFKALVKVPGLLQILQQLSCTHVITPLLDVFVPQLVSTGVKNVLTEEQSDSTPVSSLEIALDLLKEVDFEKDSVITISR